MKIFRTILNILLLLCLSSCTPSITVPTAAAEVEVLTTPTASATISPPVLKTTMGDFVIIAVRLEDEVHGDKPLAGEKFLLVSLTGPDGAKLVAGEFSLEAFQKMVQEGGDEIYILASDRSQTFSTGMGGWLEDEFVMGFRVPIEDGYTLFWPGNSPIDLPIEP